jgi:hypothetical protein
MRANEMGDLHEAQADDRRIVGRRRDGQWKPKTVPEMNSQQFERM